jgi:hypothetical protein
MTKQHVQAIIAFIAPFLVIWTAFVFTGFAFTPKDVFTNDLFWTFSVVYWVIFYPILLFAIFDN